MLAGQLALTVAALFTGAAFYVGFAEHPARMTLDDAAALRQWAPAYRRGYVMQASLAILGFGLGALAFWSAGGLLWLGGAALMIANWPFTLIAIMPTNRALGTCDPGSASRALLGRWATLHAVRTALGAAATALFLWASLG